MKTNGFKKRPESERNSSLNKSTFKIIKKCLETDNVLSNFELSNKIFAEKGVKISSEAIRRYCELWLYDGYWGPSTMCDVFSLCFGLVMESLQMLNPLIFGQYWLLKNIQEAQEKSKSSICIFPFA